MSVDSNRTISRRDALIRTGQLAGALALRGFAPILLWREVHAKFVPNSNPKAIVETTAGKVRGGIADGIHIFRGIPYGSQMVDKRRFMPPLPVEKWAGVRDMLELGNISPQGRMALGSGTRSIALLMTPVWPNTQSEDCLNLNVWTPIVNSGGKRPVMVWLHGGGFETGSGNSPMNEGTNLARRGDVVVVAVNHRLGPFGYLHLGDLAGANSEFARAGNVGMLDIVLALQWVRDNIERFGGDPNTVMIHGESGGGRKVSTMLAMPAAKGLFRRAAIQSGPGLKFPSNETQTKRTVYLLQELGLSKNDLAKLQDIPADKLVAAGASASNKLRAEFGEGAPISESYGFAPTIGPDLPRSPFDPIAPDVSEDIPVLIGTNRHEMALSFATNEQFDEVSDAQLLEQARSRVGNYADELLNVYRNSYPKVSRRVLLLLLASDFSHRMDSIKLAERRFALHRAPTYMYRFDWETPVLNRLMLAAHSFEIPHVFDNAQLCSGMTGGGPDAVAMASNMCSAWIAFARIGNPHHSALPDWPSYNTSTRATMLFNDVSVLSSDPGKDERLAWQKIMK